MAEAATIAAPAPAAPAAAPSPAPSPQPQAAEGKANLTSAFEELDKISAEVEGRPAEKPPIKDQPERAELPEPSPKADLPKPGDPVKPPKAASLREALDNTKREVGEWKAKYEALQKESSTPKEDPEKKGLSEKLTSAEKRRQELEDELRFANYERHPEYQEKYQKPFESAYTEGATTIQEFGFKENDTEDQLGQKVEGKTRKGTQEDWNAFLRMDNDEANKFAHERFGYNANELIAMRREVQKLAKAKVSALEDFRKQGGEREKSMREATEKQTKEFHGLYETSVKTALENPEYKDWFKADEGDVKGAELLEKGFKIADSAFGDTTKLTPSERAALYAAVRNRAGAFSHVNYKYRKATARVAELEARLKEFEDSEPNLDGKGGGAARPAGAIGTLAGADAMIDRMANGG